MNNYFVGTIGHETQNFILDIKAVDESNAKSLFIDEYYKKFKQVLYKHQIICQKPYSRNTADRSKNKRAISNSKIKPFTRSIKYKRMLQK